MDKDTNLLQGDMIIIEKALGKENIDEVVTLSREHREREERESKLSVGTLEILT